MSSCTGLHLWPKTGGIVDRCIGNCPCLRNHPTSKHQHLPLTDNGVDDLTKSSQKNFGGQFQLFCVSTDRKNLLGGKIMPTAANKRSCPRFRVPGATLSYRDEICQVMSLGRGGLAFSTNSRPKPGQKLSVLLTFSPEHAPIQLRGQVIYCIPNPNESNRYIIGLGFAPFSTRRGHNSPESYRILGQLEHTNNPRRAHSINRPNPAPPAANP
jgi:Tfp pilus assembly protein PilZ